MVDQDLYYFPDVSESTIYNVHVLVHARIRRGAVDPDPPPPPEQSQKYGFLAILVRIP